MLAKKEEGLAGPLDFKPGKVCRVERSEPRSNPHSNEIVRTQPNARGCPIRAETAWNGSENEQGRSTRIVSQSMWQVNEVWYWPDDEQDDLSSLRVAPIYPSWQKTTKKTNKKNNKERSTQRSLFKQKITISSDCWVGAQQFYKPDYALVAPRIEWNDVRPQRETIYGSRKWRHQAVILYEMRNETKKPSETLWLTRRAGVLLQASATFSLALSRSISRFRSVSRQSSCCQTAVRT